MNLISFLFFGDGKSAKTTSIIGWLVSFTVILNVNFFIFSVVDLEEVTPPITAPTPPAITPPINAPASCPPLDVLVMDTSS